MVLRIGDQQISFGVEQQIVRRIKLRLDGRAAVAAETAFTGSGDDGQTAFRQLQNPVRANVGNVQIAFSIQRQAIRQPQRGTGFSLSR